MENSQENGVDGKQAATDGQFECRLLIPSKMAGSIIGARRQQGCRAGGAEIIMLSRNNFLKFTKNNVVLLLPHLRTIIDVQYRYNTCSILLFLCCHFLNLSEEKY